MTVAAFLRTDYSCNSLYDTFTGVFDSEDDALNIIKGQRDQFQTIEFFNLQTLGFTTYRWIPYYKEVQEKTLDKDGNYIIKNFLGKKNQLTGEIEKIREVTTSEDEYLLARGYWKIEENDNS